MAMSILERLNGIKLEDLTPSQVESILNSTTISPQTAGDLMQASMLVDALHARSGVTAGVVQGLGGINVVTLSDASPVVDAVTAGQGWELIAIEAENGDGANAATVTIALNDGTSSIDLHSASLAASSKVQVDLGKVAAFPIHLTPQLQVLSSQSGEASSITVRIAYQVVQV